MSTINFKELKKELKDIEKLNKEHLDIKSWASELQLWIDLEEVTDPQKIYVACVLTSIGETRQVIQELKLNREEQEEENEDDDDEGSASGSDTSNPYPTFNEIVDALESFYGTKEDQNLLLRELRALRIKKNERVKDFNLKYKTLYLKLDRRRKQQVSVLDYADSLRNNVDAWKKISLKDNISLDKAFRIAEKVDRLSIRSNPNYSFDNINKPKNFKNDFSPKPYFSKYPTYKRATTPTETRTTQAEIDDLTKRMKNLSIKTCYFCNERGHYQNNCPALNAIIKKNKESHYRNNSSLN